MFKRFSLVVVLFSLASYAVDPNTFIASVSGFTGPYAIAITPDSLHAYVSDGTSIRVIDTNPSSPTFNTIVAAPGLDSVFDNVPSLAVTPNGLFAYVANYNTNSVLIIDTDPASPTYNTLVSAAGLIGAFSQPTAIAITPDGTRAYVTNVGNNTLSVIDIDPTSPSYNTILSTPSLDGILNNPFDVAVTPDGSRVYVSNLAGNMNVIDSDPASPTYNTEIAAPGLNSVNAQPQGFAILTNGLYAYVSNGAGNDVTALDVNPLSPTYNTVIAAPGLLNTFNAPNDVASSVDGSYAYVTNFLGSNGDISSVVVIDTNPASPTFNTTLSTPGLNQGSLTARYFTVAMTPNARYVYAVDGFNAVVNVIYTGIVSSPTNFKACGQRNIFLSQTEYSNVLTWLAPTVGNTPVAYKIYSDAGLTNLLATIPATDPLLYVIHNSNPRVVSTYYIVSIDDTDTASAPAIATLNGVCTK